MKNKKSLLSLGLLALILVLGVGYAVVSNVTLTFNGSATVGTADLKVDIESVTDSSTVTDREAITHTLAECGKNDTFTIKGMTLEEEVTMIYTVANHETDINAKLTLDGAITNNKPDYFNVDVTFANDGAVDAGETTTVTVVVSMIKTPLNDDDATATIGFNLIAAPTSETSNAS